MIDSEEPAEDAFQQRHVRALLERLQIRSQCTRRAVAIVGAFRDELPHDAVKLPRPIGRQLGQRRRVLFENIGHGLGRGGAGKR